MQRIVSRLAPEHNGCLGPGKERRRQGTWLGTRLFSYQMQHSECLPLTSLTNPMTLAQNLTKFVFF